MKLRSDLDFATAARAVNLLDPTAAQDAATKAYVDALPGWKDLAVIAPGPVNAIDFPAIDQAYGDLRLVLEGVSHAGGSSQQWTLAVSPDGATFSNAANLTTTVAGSAAMYGSFEIHGYRLDTGAVIGFASNIAGSPGMASGSAQNPTWRCTGGIRALRVAITGGAAFDGGKVRLQARH